MNTHCNALVKCRILILALSVFVAACATIMSPQEQANVLVAEGQQLYSAKRYDEAITKFREAVAVDPGNFSAYLGLAKSFIAKGAWSDAIASARRALELNRGGPEVVPVFLEALFGGGTDALARGNFQESIRYFVDYLKEQPSNVRAWINVGKAYMGNRQFADALGALRRGLEAGAGGADRSEIIQTIFGGGKQAFNDRDYAGAINFLREYLNYESKDWSAYLALAKAYWESGAHGEALGAFRKVLELNPRNADALKFLQAR